VTPRAVVTPELEDVRRRLAAHPAAVLEAPRASRAAVALVLRAAADEDGPALLMIRRAESDADHWSGHIAFPGGRVDPGDAGPRAAAERELAEEVGLAPPPDALLGRLDDLRGRTQAIVVSAFVYGVAGRPPVRPNYEVAEAFWRTLDELADPAAHVVRRFDYLGHALELPALAVLGEDRPVLWGLSYRFLEQLMGRLGRPIAPMPWRADL